MFDYHAQLSVNYFPVWEARGNDYQTLLAKLLTEIETEQNGASGAIKHALSDEVLFRCRKVALE